MSCFSTPTTHYNLRIEFCSATKDKSDISIDIFSTQTTNSVDNKLATENQERFERLQLSVKGIKGRFRRIVIAGKSVGIRYECLKL